MSRLPVVMVGPVQRCAFSNVARARPARASTTGRDAVPLFFKLPAPNRAFFPATLSTLCERLTAKPLANCRSSNERLEICPTSERWQHHVSRPDHLAGVESPLNPGSDPDDARV